jgi:hypothetical protein
MLLLLCIARGVGYYAVGEFTLEAWIMFAAAFPLMLAGIYVGDRIQVNISVAAATSTTDLIEVDLRMARALEDAFTKLSAMLGRELVPVLEGLHAWGEKQQSEG